MQLKRVHLKCSKSQVQQCGVSCTVHCAERGVWCHQHSRDIRLSLPHGSLYQVNQLFNSFQILMIALVFLLKVQNCSLWLLISCAQTRLLLRQHQWSSWSFKIMTIYTTLTGKCQDSPPLIYLELSISTRFCLWQILSKAMLLGQSQQNTQNGSDINWC